MAKMNEKDNAIYMAAFGESKAKTVKERMAAGEAAVAASKTSPNAGKNLFTMAEKRVETIEKAVDQGIEDGTEKNKK